MEHAFSDRPGDWRVSIVGSRGTDNWEMKIWGPNRFERSYTLVKCGRPPACGNQQRASEVATREDGAGMKAISTTSAKIHQLIGKRISVGLGIVTLTTVFERLPHDVKNVARELGELVKK
jgi:hypothetical protein